MHPNPHSDPSLFATDHEGKQSAPDVAVFDEGTFLDYVGNDRAVACRVVRRFLADAPARLAAIQQALAVGDAQTLARAAHALKGAVSFFAAAAALEAVRDVETIARTGDLQGAPGACAALGRELPRLTAAVEAFLACSPNRTQP